MEDHVWFGNNVEIASVFWGFRRCLIAWVFWMWSDDVWPHVWNKNAGVLKICYLDLFRVSIFELRIFKGVIHYPASGLEYPVDHDLMTVDLRLYWLQTSDCRLENSKIQDLTLSTHAAHRSWSIAKGMITSPDVIDWFIERLTRPISLDAYLSTRTRNHLISSRASYAGNIKHLIKM